MVTMKQASIQFLKWNPLYETEKPFQIFGALHEESTDQRKSNLAWHEEQVEVQDCRENSHEFGLDSHGFAIRRLPTFTELPDREAVIGEYIPAIKRMLQDELEDVGTVFLFDWRVCESDSCGRNDIVARQTFDICIADQREREPGQGGKHDQFQ